MSADLFSVQELLESGDLLLVQDGNHGGKYPKVGEFVDEGIPLITGACLSSGIIDFTKAQFLTPERSSSLTVGLAKPGDVLLTHKGTMGKTAIVQSNKFGMVILNPQLTLYRVKESGRLNRHFLKYFFDSPVFQSLIVRISATSTINTLSIREQKKIEIPVPSLDKQYKLVRVVGSLDDKIQLNHQANQTLEQIAQAIFKSWFVDFEPVKAKIAALEAGGSEDDALLAAMQAIAGSALFAADAADADAQTQLARLQTERPEQYATLRATAELFPSAMQESELGEIPEGWNAGQLSDIAMFTSNRISVEELSVETYISTENMLENKAGIRNAASLPSAATVIKFEPLHILVSNIRPYFKKIWLANFDGGRSADVLGFESKHQGMSEFLYNLLYQDQFFDYMMLTSKGAKMPRGDKDAIMQFAIAVPPVELMKYFSQRVEAFYNLINMNRSGARSLSELRDTLLPKLLSGELSLAAAEEQLADTVEPAHV